MTRAPSFFIAARITFDKIGDIFVVCATAGSPCFILKLSVSGPVAFSVCTVGLLMCSGLASKNPFDVGIETRLIASCGGHFRRKVTLQYV